MKKKMLLLGSFSAMILSAALLVTPSSASSIIHRCSTCSKIVDGGKAVEVSPCQPLTADSCFCPLPAPLQTNSCF